MKQMGLSVSAISELTGYSRKTVRKYLLNPEGVPDYPRTAGPSKLDPPGPNVAFHVTITREPSRSASDPTVLAFRGGGDHY